MQTIARLVLSALAFLLVANVVPGVEVRGFWWALLLAIVWGILSLLVRPVLIVLTLPITVVTFGLFLLVLNALLFWFLGNIFVGFSVAGFGAAFFGALVLSILLGVIDQILEKQ